MPKDIQKNGPFDSILKAMNPPVFLGSAFVVIFFVVFGGLFTSTARSFFSQIQNFIVTYFGWSYVISASFFLVFVLWLMMSRYGKIRLGDDHSRPEFSYFAWFGMLFCAGMGTGLVFWGVAEPLSHYMSPPFAKGESYQAMTESLRFSFLHWGFHPWAIYSIFGAALGPCRSTLVFRKSGTSLIQRSSKFQLLGASL